MPASRSKTCASCARKLPFSDFRDEDVRTGRTPDSCRACRDAVPALAAQQERQRATRPRLLARNARYRARTAEELAADQAHAYPEGVRTCPPGSGCGKLLHLDAFLADPSQPHGLSAVCVACEIERHALRRAAA